MPDGSSPDKRNGTLKTSTGNLVARSLVRNRSTQRYKLKGGEFTGRGAQIIAAQV